MSFVKPGTPLKFVKHSDNCPHEIDCPKTKRVRLFLNGIKYKGKCYSTCKCGGIVLDMEVYHANRLIDQRCAECVNDMVPVSEPGHECCSKHKDDPVPPTPVVTPVIDPVAKPPAGAAVVRPTPVEKPVDIAALKS